MGSLPRASELVRLVLHAGVLSFACVLYGWDGVGWDGMGWGGMGWDGMGWDGMGWDGMGWVSKE